MLRILAICLLLAYPFRSDLGCVANPQLEVQFRQQWLNPARVPTGFHPDAHLLSLDRKIAIKRFRFLAMFQSSFPAIPSFTTHKRNLLKGWVVVAS
jgi:hypothetical protein